MPAYTHLISDCDGVLLDSEAIAFDALLQQLAPLLPGQDLDTLVRPRLGLTLPDLLADIGRQHPLPLGDDAVAAMRHHIEDEVARLARPIRGVDAALRAIPLPKACASNSAANRVRSSLAQTGLLAHFGPHVYCADEVGIAKPDPGLFLHAARGLGASPARCLVVEDSVTGTRAASAAGMTVLGFTGAGHIADGQAQRLRDCGARHTFDDMADLPALVARLCQAQP